MSTVARPGTRTIIEIPARFKPLDCDRVAALFQDTLASAAPLAPDLVKTMRQARGTIASNAVQRVAFCDTEIRRTEVVCTGADCPELGGIDLDGFIEMVPVTTTRALEVRCSMRDCPGHAGWVFERAIADAAAAQTEAWPKLLYLMPRGYKFSDSVIVPTARMKEQRRRGYDTDRGYMFAETIGRADNRLAFDHLTTPFHPREMPADAFTLRDSDDALLVRCPACEAPRFLRVTGDAATAHLPNERCGMVESVS